MANQYKQQLEKCLSMHPNAPLMVHSDLFRANFFIEKSLNRGSLLKNHSQTLQDITHPSNLWIPVFNYQFPKIRSFDISNSKSELGPLNEFMRLEWAKERSIDPIFSFASLEPICIDNQIEDELVAFSHQTAFSELVKKQGGILFYGADISSATIIHHIEFLAGYPLYRYDKIFKGTIINKHGTKQDISYKYHVRPLKKHIDYNWVRLKQDLSEAGLLSTVSKGNIDLAIYLSASDLASFWLGKLEADPFYLLDEISRSWAEPMVNQLGRRLEITDFEG